MDVITLLVGIGIGYYFTKTRIDEVKDYHKNRIEDYKDAFSKGYETRNGIEPFTEEKRENQVVSSDFEPHTEEVEEEFEPVRRAERWDD